MYSTVCALYDITGKMEKNNFDNMFAHVILRHFLPSSKGEYFSYFLVPFISSVLPKLDLQKWKRRTKKVEKEAKKESRENSKRNERIRGTKE
jgi:hypothetical protein